MARFLSGLPRGGNTKKEIRHVDKEKNIIQVTTVDERFYARETKDPKTGLPVFEYVPSVSWISSFYPRGVAYFKWLASKGWSEAEEIKNAAGDKGSKVHAAVKDLIDGEEVAIDAKYLNPSTGEEEGLTYEEYECIMSFALWCKETSPKFIKSEFVVWGDGYAGTVDLLCKLGGEQYIIDFKSSQYVWPSHEIQVSAYKHAGPFEEAKLAILQVGYRFNKKRYKFTEIEDQYNLFLAAKTIWSKEQEGVSPKRVEYPLSVKLAGPTEETWPTLAG